jgi:hypothetical protein
VRVERLGFERRELETSPEKEKTDQPDANIETDPGMLAALVFHGRPLVEALRSEDIKIEGDK